MTASGSRKPGVHRPSTLLTPEENQECVRVLGARCPSLATTIVQFFTSINGKWVKQATGVLCFVKDNPKRSYYIRIIDLDRGSVVFDQEVYNQFRYKTPRSYFHTFEGEDSQIGLNFAHETEATTFKNILDLKLTERRDRKERRNALKRNQNMERQQNNHHHSSSTPVHSLPTIGGTPPKTSFNNPFAQTAAMTYKVKHYNRKKLKKEDISRPTNFQHISHVGWDPNRGFDLENVDPKLLQFFSRAGVSERELRDKDTRDFIYNFIDRHGGLEAAIEEVDRREQQLQRIQESRISAAVVPLPPPPVPAPPPRQSSMATRPPPPSRVQASPGGRAPPVPKVASANNTASTKGTAPPPPPPPPPPQPPPLPSMTEPPTAPPSHSSFSVVPAPPPPPPALPAVVDDTRSSLMEEIRRGSSSLRHVNPEDRKSHPTLDNRDGLLDQIRTGIILKKVDVDSASSSGGEAPTAPAGIAGMLQRALQERSTALRFSSSDEESEDEDDEWDD